MFVKDPVNNQEVASAHALSEKEIGRTVPQGQHGGR